MISDSDKSTPILKNPSVHYSFDSLNQTPDYVTTKSCTKCRQHQEQAIKAQKEASHYKSERNALREQVEKLEQSHKLAKVLKTLDIHRLDELLTRINEIKPNGIKTESIASIGQAALRPLRNAPPKDIDARRVMWYRPKNLSKMLDVKVEEEEDGDDDEIKSSKKLACIVERDGIISTQLFDIRAEARITLSHVAAHLGHYYPSYRQNQDEEFYATFRNVMEAKFPVLAMCQGNWKADHVGIQIYTSWKRSYNGTAELRELNSPFTSSSTSSKRKSPPTGTNSRSSKVKRVRHNGDDRDHSSTIDLTSFDDIHENPKNVPAAPMSNLAPIPTLITTQPLLAPISLISVSPPPPVGQIAVQPFTSKQTSGGQQPNLPSLVPAPAVTLMSTSNDSSSSAGTGTLDSQSVPVFVPTPVNATALQVNLDIIAPAAVIATTTTATTMTVTNPVTQITQVPPPIASVPMNTHGTAVAAGTIDSESTISHSRAHFDMNTIDPRLRNDMTTQADAPLTIEDAKQDQDLWLSILQHSLNQNKILPKFAADNISAEAICGHNWKVKNPRGKIGEFVKYWTGLSESEKWDWIVKSRETAAAAVKKRPRKKTSKFIALTS